MHYYFKEIDNFFFSKVNFIDKKLSKHINKKIIYKINWEFSL